MTNVLVRDVPAHVHSALQQKAQRKGQSLQQFLTGELIKIATKPSVEEVFERIERQHGGRVGLKQAAKDIAEERARR
ncbi:MAG: FitA-like ribbon-helix-helix domain-containing protein [Acidimicrobiales bacterium]